MSGYRVLFLWFALSMDIATAHRSGFVDEYIGKNYTSIIQQRSYMIKKQVDSKSSCLFGCLEVNGCVMTVFNRTNSQCMLYDVYPNVTAELLLDSHIIVSVFESSTSIRTVDQSSSFWSFDNTTSDSLSIYNGVGVNDPRFQTPGIDGYGFALSVNGTEYQYVNVSTYRNLYHVSFTIEMWFYCTNLTNGQYGLFGQHSAAIADQSLAIEIENNTLLFSFYLDDLSGSTTIQVNTWYHAAFVYDYPSATQEIYLNGQLDGSRLSSAYAGTSGAIVIGKTEQIRASPNYFSGYMNKVSLVMRTKNASEVLNDATLATWNSFDTIPYLDSGPLNLTITAVNVTSVTGRVKRAIRFTSNASYYQVGGFVLLGVPHHAYSISLWIRPFVINGAILVHLSATTIGQGWRIDLIGLSYTGNIIITTWGGSPQEIIGPILPNYTWTHIVSTYSTYNGYNLYINGTLIGTNNSTDYFASNEVDILTLGSSLQGIPASFPNGTCTSQSIVPNVCSGLIDEFRVYSRELDPADIYSLAHP